MVPVCPCFLLLKKGEERSNILQLRKFASILRVNPLDETNHSLKQSSFTSHYVTVEETRRFLVITTMVRHHFLILVGPL